MWGHREQQLQVQVDPERLQAEGVTLDEVISTTGNALWVSHLTFLEASTPGAGGFFETASQRIGVEHSQPIQSPDDLAQVPLADDGPVSSASARSRRSSRITSPSSAIPRSATQQGLLIVVEKLPEANALEVTEDLEAALDSMAPGLTGIDLDARSSGRPSTSRSNDNLQVGAHHRGHPLSPWVVVLFGLAHVRRGARDRFSLGPALIVLAIGARAST